MSVGVAMKCSQRYGRAFSGQEPLTMSENALSMPACAARKVMWEFLGIYVLLFEYICVHPVPETVCLS